MGIKTKFCSMGRTSAPEQDLGDLSLWRYSNDVVAGKTLLYNYTGSWYNSENTEMQLNAFYNSTSLFPRNCAYLPSGTTVKAGLQLYTNDGQQANVKILSVINTNTFTSNRYPNGYGTPTRLYVRNASIASNFDVTANIQVVNYNDPITLYIPKAKGKAIINDWYNTSSGTLDTDRNTPFYNNLNVVNVDFQGVPFRNNSMFHAFNNCRALITVNNIPNSVTNIGYTFYNCYNLNQNIQIPNSVTSMYGTFSNCYNLKQNISNLCNGRTSLTNAYAAFYSTPITNASHCFAGCTSLTNADAFQGCTWLADLSFTFERTAINQSINIPVTITNMYGTFYYATALNSPITIPMGVTDMTYCFNGCSAFNSTVSIPSTVKYAAYCFAGCSKFAADLSNYCNGYTALTNIYYCFASSGIVNGVNAFANISTSIYASHCFDNCRSLTNIQDTLAHCANLTTAENCFNNCTGLKDVGFCIFESNKFTGNICFHATEITAANKIFSNNNSTRKNVYIYFTYANGVKTTTWNTFSTALWYYANGKANAKAKKYSNK